MARPDITAILLDLAELPQPLQIKALSWALRELGLRDPEAVVAYINEREDRLAPRVLREVRNKLETGHKDAKPSEAMQRRMRERRSTG